MFPEYDLPNSTGIVNADSAAPISHPAEQITMALCSPTPLTCMSTHRSIAANVPCIQLIAKHRQGGAHMRASWIISGNEVIAHLGVILSGTVVLYRGNHVPDLIVGGLISIVVIRSRIRILGEAKETR